jgi:Flp pilus assembly pilin Flp
LHPILSMKIKFHETVKRFCTDESGAITVDWVVLSAGIVGLAIAVMVSVGGATADMGDLVSGNLGSQRIATY